MHTLVAFALVVVLAAWPLGRWRARVWLRRQDIERHGSVNLYSRSKAGLASMDQ